MSDAGSSFWTTKEVLIRRIEGEQFNSYYRGAMPHPAMKPWQRFLLVTAACVFVGYVIVFVAQRRDLIALGGISSRALHHCPALRDRSASNTIQETKDDQSTVPGSIPNAGPLAQDLCEGDRKFLDDLVRKQNQDDHQDGNSPPVQDIGKARTVDSSPKSVPRAELVINTEIVRRGELVVHSGALKRKPQSITP